ncbi:MAG: DUF1622 domain-containing protein [Leeuwenhoekiella sp.]
MEEIELFIHYVAKIVEIIGIAIISIGTVIALIRYLKVRIKGQKDGTLAYQELRHKLGRAILLGLEVLVAADIIATVVTKPTMDRVLTLGVIVLIRTFLSLSLQVEIEGKFPWQAKRSK